MSGSRHTPPTAFLGMRIYTLLLTLLLTLYHPNLSKAQIITTVAGNGSTVYSGDGHIAIGSGLPVPGDIIIDSLGLLHIFSSFAAARIVNVNSSGIMTTEAGNGVSGYSGDWGFATSASIQPTRISFDIYENLLVADYYNSRLRLVNATTDIITTIGGTGIYGYSGDGGPATLANMTPNAVTTDSMNNIYISDGLGRIRRVAPDETVSTFVGNGTVGDGGDGGLAIDAELRNEPCICFDDTGFMYIGCVGRIRRVNLATGIISTFAGTGCIDYAGDGMDATLACFGVFGLRFNKADHSLYICDRYNDQIYKIDPSGIFHLVAGNGTEGFSGDGGPATDAQLHDPEGIDFDDCGNVYIADNSNSRIRKVEYVTSPSALLSSTLGDTVCAGTSVTLHAALTAFTSLHIDWFLNGSLAASGSSFTFTPLSSDSVYCRVRGIAACSGDTLTRYSNARTYVVLPLTPVSLSVTPMPAATLCAGIAVTVNATSAGGSPSSVWHWYVNGTTVATSGSSYSYTPLSGDSVSVVWVSGATCPTPADTLESHILLSVLPVSEPAIMASWDVSASSVCMWDTIHASVALTGPPGTLSWLRNGIPVGIITPSYTFVPASGDSISCIYTSSYTCAIPSVLHSNVLGPVTVVPRTLPTIALTASSTDAVAGTVVTINAVVGGTAYYQIYWYINGVETSTSTLPYMTYTKGTGTDAIMAKVAHIGAGCYDTGISAPLIIAEHTGISYLSGATSALIYPNPATSQLSISYGAGLQSVTITDMLGRTVLRQTFTGQHAAELPLQLSPGCYLIAINHLPPQKLIIQ